MFKQWERQLYRCQFTRSKQQAFLEDLNALVSDGVPANQAVGTLRAITEGVSQKVAQSILDSLSQGKLMADGMIDWFSRSIVEIIRAGELGGALEKTLSSAVNSFREKRSATAAFVNSLLYPLLVFVVACIVLVFLKNSVLMTFAQIKPLTTWPTIGQNLYLLASIAQKAWWALLLLVFAILIGLVKLLSDLTGNVRAQFDRAPIFSLYREIIAARFMETLGLLITNGVVLKNALSVMHRDASAYLSWHLLKMEYRLGAGKENVADVLDTDLIRHEDVLRLRVVAMSKGFDQALVSLGRQARVRNLKKVELLGKVLGGFFLILSALMAGIMVFGIYSVGSTLAA